MPKSTLDEMLDEIFNYVEAGVQEMHEFMLSSIESLSSETERELAQEFYADQCASYDERLEAQFGVRVHI